MSPEKSEAGAVVAPAGAVAAAVAVDVAEGAEDGAAAFRQERKFGRKFGHGESFSDLSCCIFEVQYGQP